jgi:hypothetical protein
MLARQPGSADHIQRIHSTEQQQISTIQSNKNIPGKDVTENLAFEV